ncbi:hypothetical protein [Actinomadura fibrosa]|uniref:Secreted protein n=1 Tax=Actinomadura fibrosa TaxID=111802 RepID=A0ABW2Y0P0_9ACTN|nr:hypothetical protein [Actinomadura fibrosa]
MPPTRLLAALNIAPMLAMGALALSAPSGAEAGSLPAPVPVAGTDGVQGTSDDDGLPKPGQVTKLNLHDKATLRCDDRDYTLALHGTVEVKAGSPGSEIPPKIPLKVTAAELTGRSDDFGTVKATLDGPQPGSIVSDGKLKPFPATHTLPLSLKITLDKSPCATGSRGYEPLVLTTKNPAQLVGKLTQFPPKGDVYRLQNPVDLVTEDDSTAAVLQDLNVDMDGV